MKVLIDTNLLVRLDDQAHATHAEAVAAIGVLKANGLGGSDIAWMSG